MSDTRTQGADGHPTATTPSVEGPTNGSRPAAPPAPPVRSGSSPVEDTSVRPAWRTKLQGRRGGEESHDGVPTPARPHVAVSAAARPAAAAARRPRGPRKARLRVTRIDPWSVMKTAFLLSIAFAVVTVVSVTIVWSVLGAAGVWESVNASVQQVVGGQDTNNFDIENYVGMSRVLGFTMLISVLDIVLITAVSTLAAFLYNLSAALLGGIEVTLAEDGR